MTYCYVDMDFQYYDEVINLWNQSDGVRLTVDDEKENLRTFVERNKDLCLLCKSEDKVIGTILCGFDGRRAYIYHLAVLADYRQKGIGKKLVSLIIHRLKELGVKKCHLFVVGTNLYGKEFWTRMGFEKRQDIDTFSYGIN